MRCTVYIERGKEKKGKIVCVCGGACHASRVDSAWLVWQPCCGICCQPLFWFCSQACSEMQCSTVFRIAAVGNDSDKESDRSLATTLEREASALKRLLQGTGCAGCDTLTFVTLPSLSRSPARKPICLWLGLQWKGKQQRPVWFLRALQLVPGTLHSLVSSSESPSPPWMSEVVPL